MLGAECSNEPEKNRALVNVFVAQFSVIPIFQSINVFAKEKARLRFIGKLISDFDILIGSTAVTQQMVMVTDNVQHWERIEGITIENWAQQASKQH